MAAHFTSRLCGDAGDPFQTLWAWRWLRDALFALKNPFFTDRLYHPLGATLVFQTFDLPIALLAVPLWSILPPFGVYNAGVLFAFWLTAFGMFRLARELTGDSLASLCAGVLFAAVPYHLAHLQGHQNFNDMGWTPLFFVYLHRVLQGRARLRDGAMGGLFLALASLANWYHLLFALAAAPVLFIDAALRRRAALFTRAFAGQALLLAAVFLALAGPLLVAMGLARGAESVAGAHDAHRFSGDLEAFFFPNLAQATSSWFGGRAYRWSGNSAETALYAGYTALAAAVLGVVLSRRARAWAAVALVGAALALGPHLRIGGQQVSSAALPYAWLEAAFPAIQFTGVPVRFGYVMYLGLLAAGVLGLAQLRARMARPWVREAALFVPTTLLLLEYAPRPLIETEAVPPRPMLDWARDPGDWSVLDVSGDFAMMFHATLHRKAMTGGNLSRVPDRLERWYWGHEVVRAVRGHGVRMTEVGSRTDASIDFWWGGGAPDPRLPADRFRIEWAGTLEAPAAGRWTFRLSSDDAAQLWIDGRQVVENGGVHPWQERAGALDLAAGPHSLRAVYEESELDAGVRLEWEGPGVARQVLAGPALVGGLRARLFQGLPDCLLDGPAARRQLQSLNVRYMVTGGGGSACAERAWGLPETYRGEGVRIYEVSAR
jgi:hypothetical protein